MKHTMQMSNKELARHYVKRISLLCSACIEAKEIHGFGDGGHACTCQYEGDSK